MSRVEFRRRRLDIALGDDLEHEVTVEAFVDAGAPARTDGRREDSVPASGARVESDVDIYDQDGNVVDWDDLTECDRERIIWRLTDEED